MFKQLILLTILISSSYASTLHRFSKDVEEVQKTNSPNNIWVVLVAGSYGYFNYRHQADVLHAYQLVKNVHKIPKEQIILMMYDDIANNDKNPVKGNVINVPNGENLYTDDIEKDYVGDQVLPSNFLGVLTKDSNLIEKKKKVLNSTSEDFVFIFFSDHGAPGFVSFPRGILTASKFHEALNKMKENNSYRKMAIYFESCESGSMFAKKLNPGQNVYALTAASPSEPSYATFFDNKRGTYLADEFSVNWILDSYAADQAGRVETLHTQFLDVKNKTKKSHVSEWGDLGMGEKDTIDEFQGKKEKGSNVEIKLPTWSEDDEKTMRSDEVEYYLTRIHSQMNNDDSFEKLVLGRQKIDQFMNNLKTEFALKLNVDKELLIGKNEIENTICYEEIINHLSETCAPLYDHGYFYRHLYIIVNTCNEMQKQNRNLNPSELNEIITQQCVLVKDFLQTTKVV